MWHGAFLLGMAWFSISFDGEGLAYARITRHDHRGVVYLVTGPAVKGPRGREYPTASRLEGFQRVRKDEILGLLERQYGNAREDDGVIRVTMQADRLWADPLTHLQAFEKLFGPPHLRIADGHVTVFVESKGTLPDAAVLGRLDGAAPATRVAILEAFDPAPWQGLESTLVA